MIYTVPAGPRPLPPTTGSGVAEGRIATLERQLAEAEGENTRLRAVIAQNTHSAGEKTAEIMNQLSRDSVAAGE